MVRRWWTGGQAVMDSTAYPLAMREASVEQFSVQTVKYAAFEPFHKVTLAMTKAPESLPVTIFEVPNSSTISRQWLESYIETELRPDDVWQDGFLKGCIFVVDTKGVQTLDEDAKAALKLWGSTFQAFIPRENGESRAMAGPAYLEQDVLRRVGRLYNDTNGAFMTPFEIDDANSAPSNNLRPLRITGTLPQSFAVAVRSRAGLFRSQRLPLQGVRMAVKDIFDLKGVKMSACNRAYYSVADPASENAPFIQSLIDAGAQLVGSTKLSSMISREEPTEAVDFQAPFNPRGDGYQSPAGSSSGTAAAIAAYPWLDLGVGSDSTGSSRRPAAVSGCYQIRLTQSFVNMHGIMPCSAEFDAPALFARDLAMLVKASAVVCKDHDQGQRKLPVSLLYPTEYFPTGNADQNVMIDRYIDELSKNLGIDVCKISIDEVWAKDPPRDAGGLSREEYLSVVGKEAFLYDFYHATDNFRKTYRQEHQKDPFVNSFVKWRWDTASQISKDDRDAAFVRMDSYKSWFLSHFLEANGQRSFMVLPIAETATNYRNTPPKPPFIQSGADDLFLAAILRAPELSVPVGQVKYHSSISGKAEYLPVLISLLGPPGSDFDLMHMVDTFQKRVNTTGAVLTGPVMFDV